MQNSNNCDFAHFKSQGYNVLLVNVMPLLMVKILLYFDMFAWYDLTLMK